MSELDKLLKEATQKFDDAIYSISTSGEGEINNIAGRVIEKIQRRELYVVANNAIFNIPTSTGFELSEIPGVRVTYAPVLVLDIEKALTQDSESIKADLVRTLAIVDQYSFNGFERRYKEIYGDALKTQTSWLNQNETPQVAFDPRFNEKEELLRELLGDARYYSDVGFDDWQKAVEGQKNMVLNSEERNVLNQLKDATAHFLSMRQRFVPQGHEIAMQKAGDVYLKNWDMEKRAEAMAYNLVGMSVYARRPEN